MTSHFNTVSMYLAYCQLIIKVGETIHPETMLACRGTRYSGIHDAHSTPSTPSTLDNNEGEIPFIMVVLANRPSKRSVRTLLTDQKTEEGGRVF